MMIKSLLRKKQPSLKKPSDFYPRINQISYELFISEINQVIYSIRFVYVSVLHESDVIWLLLKIFSLVGGLLFGPANILVEYIPLYGRAREQLDDYADGIWVFLLA